MKTLMVLVTLCFITLSLTQGCGFVIPDYISKSEVEDSLELRLKGELVKKETEVLDSAGIIATKSSENNYLTDEFGRKLVIVINPHNQKKQKVDIYDSEGNFLREATLAPNTKERLHLTQTTDEKLFFRWQMGDKIFTVEKEFPFGPPKMTYEGELCHSLSYGWGN